MSLRILMVTSSLPHPPTSGAAIRIFQFARHLAQRNPLTLLSYGGVGDESSAAELRAMGMDVTLVPPPNRSWKRLTQLASLASSQSHLGAIFQTARLQQAIDAALADGHDVVIVEGSLLMRHRLHGGTPLVLDEHNLEFEALERTARTETSPVRRRFNVIEAAKFKREELEAWKRADLCVFTSEREIEIARGLRPGIEAISVPNGVDTGYFRPGRGAVDARSIVFTGTLAYRPNADAVAYLVRDILPRILRTAPDAIVTIVGGGAPASITRLAGPHALFTGRVPDVRPFLEHAAVVVAPLRIGSGTRLKVLEAFAMGKAMVSTSLGCEGIDCRAGEHLVVADDPQKFADAVVRLLRDPVAAAAMGARGRALAERSYRWTELAASLEEALQEVVARRRAQPAVMMSAG